MTDLKMNKKIIVLGVIIILAAALLFGRKYLPQKSDIGPEAAGNAIKSYMTGNLVKAGTDVAIKNVVKDGDLYRATVTLQKQDYTMYITKDGAKFFPQGFDTVKTAADNSQPKTDQAPAPQADAPKQDVPEVQLFVMSYCPYGTQMEKGILPVLDTLKDKIKFNLEFVSYSMHNSLATNDRKELDENLRQYCIQKNQPEKLDAYLSCFLKKGQGTEADCMTSTGVDASTVSSCTAQADSQFNVTKDFNDQNSYQNGFPIFEVNKDDNTKYSVQGSPTLVVDGTVVQPSGRDSASILKTICSAFNNPPAECNTQLSSTAPSPGFGEGTGSGGSASCGK